VTFSTQLSSAFTPIGGVYDTPSITQALSWAQTFVEGYCNRSENGFDLVTGDTVYLDPKPYRQALLPRIPVVNIGSVLAQLPARFNLVPSPLLGVPSGTGGTFVAGQYYWVVTALMPWGAETPASNEVTATFTGSTSSIALSWPAVPQATGYKVYRGYLPVSENILVTTLGATTTYTDTGTAGTGGVPPSGMMWTPLINYALVSDTGLIYDTTGQPGTSSSLGPSWPWLPASLKVTYDHGYSTVPQGLINAACRFAQQYLENPAILLQRDVGSFNERYAGNTGGVGIVINEFDKRIMDRYTLIGIA
jgi:hypothetical protein